MIKKKLIALVCSFSLVFMPLYSEGEVEEVKKEEKVKEKDKQEEKSEAKKLETEVITVTRTSDSSKLNTPTAISVISSSDMAQKGSRTLPDALSEIPGVMVQKTSYGQGSPYIRGFTGFRNLLLIDGVRFNNSVFRDGPNQYWNTIDSNSIGRIEVMRGAGSLLYGSDAIGGVVNGVTKEFEFQEDRKWGASQSLRYATAERSWISRTELGYKIGDALTLSGGFTYKDFGDLKGGKDVGVQEKTGYDEINSDFKVQYKFKDDSKLTAYHQNTNQNDAWRTHATVYGISFDGTKIGGDKERILFQDRNLSYLQYSKENMDSWIDSFKVGLSYQYQKERQSRIKKDDTGNNQGFSDKNIGFFSQAESKTVIGKLTYGVDFYQERVDSFSDKYKADGSFGSSDIQGPVGDDAKYQTAEVFILDHITIGESFSIFPGIRFTKVDVEVEKFKDPITKAQTSLSESYSDFVGSLKLQYIPKTSNFYNFYAGLNQSFRSPNLSDLTRLDIAKSGELEIASTDLDSEKYLTFETGVKAKWEKVEGEISIYRTNIDDMIIRVPTGELDGTNVVVTKKNSGSGFVHGIELNLSYQFYKNFKAFGYIAWQDSELESYPDSTTVSKTEPLSKMLPLSGLIGLRWQNNSGKFWAEGILKASDNQDDLTASDKADVQRIPPGGTAGYATFGLRSGYQVNSMFSFNLAAENIGNIDYRIHGSGVNEPGINIIFSAKISY